MKITIEGASPEFERKLLELLAEHREELAVTTDTAWNVEGPSSTAPPAQAWTRLGRNSAGTRSWRP